MRIVAAALAVSLVLPSFAFPIQSSSPSTGWIALKSIAQGEDLLVHTKDGKKTKGQLLSISDSNLELSAKGGRATFTPADVLRIYHLRGRRIVKFTLIGAAVGAGSGAAIGAATGKADGIPWGRGGDAAIVGAMGLLIGTVTGLLVGTFSRKKELVYQAPPAR
jgi:hypothetical protein